MTSASSNISANDIALLIEAAAKSGVLHFKLGDFEVSFAKKEDPQNHTAAFTKTPLDAASVSQTIDREIDKEDEENIRELQMAEMMMADPLRYEEMLMREGVKSNETEATV